MFKMQFIGPTIGGEEIFLASLLRGDSFKMLSDRATPDGGSGRGCGSAAATATAAAAASAAAAAIAAAAAAPPGEAILARTDAAGAGAGVEVCMSRKWRRSPREPIDSLRLRA